MVDPVWRGASGSDEGWSLVLTFEAAPREQGNPSIGTAEFYLEGAPAEWLRPGSSLQLFERATQQTAWIDVLD